MTPDVNVLVAASRSDHPHHEPARAWLELALTEAMHDTPLIVQPMVLASFIRLVTNPRIFIQPSPIVEALGFADALLAAPGVHLASLAAEWPQFRKLCADKGLTANQIPDAWLASAVLQQGEHLVSFDTDFRRLLPRSQFTLLKT